MDVGLLAIIICFILLVLMATGLPVSFCLMAIAMVPFILIRGPDSLTVMFLMAFRTMTKDYFIALPEFIFMAAVLEFSGLGSAMYDIMYKWFAGLRGGLAMGTIAIATVMAAMSGLVATATLTMGMLAYPEMIKRGYDKRMSIGVIPAGGILGPLIPPSGTMIVVAGIASLSIGKLFMAGVFPGLLASAGFMAYVAIRCYLKPTMGPPIPVEERASWKEKILSLRVAGLPFLLIFMVLGFLYMGICTPTEAGGIGAIGALICAAIYRNLTWSNLCKSASRCLRLTSMLLWLIIAGNFFSQMLGVLGVQAYIHDLVVGLDVNRWVILTGLLGSVYIIGMFMDDAPIIVIFLPIFMPIATSLGFDPLWFGFVFTVDMLIAIMTPPFGMALFFFKGLNHPGVTMTDIYRAIIPFVIIMTGVMILCIAFPIIPMWLPGTMIR